MAKELIVEEAVTADSGAKPRESAMLVLQRGAESGTPLAARPQRRADHRP
jgi:hypothetical protein